MCGLRPWGPPPLPVAKNGPFSSELYKEFSSAGTGPIFPFLGRLGTFRSISFCGTLRFAPWVGLLPVLIAFLLVWASPVGPPPPPHKLKKTVRFRKNYTKNLAAPRPAPFSNFWPFGPSFPFSLALWAFISFHFGLVGLFPFILALRAFISFRFGLVGLHFLAFLPFPGQLLGVPPQGAKKAPFSISHTKNLAASRPAPFSNFGLLGLHFLSFWPCGPSFPFILAFSGSASWGPPPPPPTSCQKWPVFPISHTKNLPAPKPAPFSNFWPFGPSFPFILAFSVAPANCKKWSGARGNQYEGEKKRDFKMTTAHWQGSSDQMLAQVPKYKENESSKASKRHVSTTVSLPRP